MYTKEKLEERLKKLGIDTRQGDERHILMLARGVVPFGMVSVSFSAGAIQIGLLFDGAWLDLELSERSNVVSAVHQALDLSAKFVRAKGIDQDA